MSSLVTSDLIINVDCYIIYNSYQTIDALSFISQQDCSLYFKKSYFIFSFLFVHQLYFC